MIGSSKSDDHFRFPPFFHNVYNPRGIPGIPNEFGPLPKQQKLI